MTRQDVANDDAYEIGPSLNAGGLMLTHEPHRFHQVGQQNDGLLPHQSDLRPADGG